MQLYAASSRQFIEDSVRNQLTGKLTDAYFRHFRSKPMPSEVRSWQNSLLRMSSLLEHAGLTDNGVLLEYQLPLTSKRLDCMLTGTNGDERASAVVVELKQWETTQPSNIDDCVTTFLGGRLRDVLHPSRQVGQYREYLADFQTSFADGRIALDACSYLHNLHFDPADELFNPRFDAARGDYPIFTGDQSDELANYLHVRVGRGDGQRVLADVLESKYRPSKKLLDHTAAMVNGQHAYVLLDEQLVVFNAVLQEVRRGFHDRRKAIILVHGGPGTGKSVIALHLIGALSGQEFNAQHATGSKAFTENLRKIVGTRAGGQFKYFNSYPTAELDEIDVLIMDEAHRIRETSVDRWTRKAERSGKRQIDELIHAAKVGVFFIDDLQVVRAGEIGSSDLIRQAAVDAGATLQEFDLEAQFRCAGSEAFINWVDTTLGVRRTANVLWDNDDPFDFQIMDAVEDVERAIRDRAAEGYTARLTAGFCWKWSKPLLDGSLVPDVVVGDWRMPWNARSGAGRLAPGIPKETYWASDPRGIEQVGCIYTAQGFEFDYVGVIWGRDLRYDPTLGRWVGDPRESEDGEVKRAKEAFLDLVKNTYRVLLTRGMKGCYVYFMDDATRNFVRSRME